MKRVRKEIGLHEHSEYIGEGISVAVLDTGVAPHPDLTSSIYQFHDFVNGEREIYDDQGHGTHICGIIAGNGKMSNGYYKGIAPGVRLSVFKVLDQHGNGESKCILEALEYIAEEKITKPGIINISVGLENQKYYWVYDRIEAVLEQLLREGVMVICSAGNNGPGDNSAIGISNHEDVLMVGCYDLLYRANDRNACAYYSGRGKKMALFPKPDLVAPGTGIISCGKEYKSVPYVKKSGTSMATAIVSGACALYMEKYGSGDCNYIRKKILADVIDLKLERNMQGKGFLNLKNLT